MPRAPGAGFLLVVVTNQPEIARGTLAGSAVDEIHERLAELLPLDDIVTCPHDDADGCECRKPRPGMLLDAASRLGIDLDASYGSATAGATSRPEAAPAAAPSSWTASTVSRCQIAPT